ncbi:MAG: Smr/MutS family protein [Gemmatimonadales bacterium]|nr:Smr/MutS family protein [Gemmatimonadales bacterium]
MPRQPRYSSHDALLDARPAVTLDLHGRTEAEARAAVEKLVRGSGASGKVVHIITGKGKSSRGSPVLKNLVRGMLKGSLAPLVREWDLDDGEGGYRVLVR